MVNPWKQITTDRTPEDRRGSAVDPLRPPLFTVTSLRRSLMPFSEGYIFPFFNTERRIGQFSQELETQQGGETRFGTHHYGENQTKTQVLKDVGIDIAHASRYGLTPFTVANFHKRIRSNYLPSKYDGNSQGA